MKKNNALIAGLILVLAVGAALAFSNRNNSQSSKVEVPEETNEQKQQPNETPAYNTPSNEAIDYVLLKVPFTAQAPTANWSDPRQQDGCEEASLIMAYAWVKGHTSINAQEAEKTIIDMSEFELREYGNYLDLNAADTAKLMKDYFKYDKTRVQYDITIEDIKKELRAGNLVIVPANGKRLNNPNFTNGGPLTHMLVIKGFDEKKKQVITNDPGTRKGYGYTYSYETILNAIVDYPTGHHEDQTGRPKAMIVIEK